MQGVKNFEFQEDAADYIKKHCFSKNNKKTLLIKAPTGAGKTIILLKFIESYCREKKDKVAFIWLTPGAGDLEEQSLKQLNKRLPLFTGKDLDEILSEGFSDKDVCFINWERVTKKDNIAIRDSEKFNIFEQIVAAHNESIKFIIIIDEEHSNDTEKAQELITKFDAMYVIRVSATPQKNNLVDFYEIEEKSVIDEGLITKALFINFDVDEKRVDDEVKFLILKAEKKRKEILEEYLKIEKNINPLVLIQFPSESPNLMEHTLNTLSSIGKSVHNGLTGVWMADNHMNTDDITLNDAPQQYLLVKQAISKGWDCPRAKILIKLREHMSEDFELQTLGRLRRMPEAMHYENEVLDNSYLYTFDEKFKEAAINIGGLEHVNLKLKKEFMRFSLKKELRSHTYENLGERETRQKILEYFIKKYNLVAGEYASNLIKFEENGYETSQQLLRNIVNDSVEITSVLVDSRLNRQDIYLAVDTHIHGRFLQQNINSFRTHLRLDFDATKALFKNLFRDTSETDHLLQLTNHEFYAFIINNASLIRKDLEKCMSNSDVSQNIIKKKDIIVEEFSFPETMTYSIVSFPEEKHTYEKNIYDNYTNQLTKWAPEKSFEQWCDKNADWFFKNGDHGNQYLSIVYRDGLDNLDLFFPDYILEIDSELWIIETKGGQSTGGNDENIDSFASQKFDALKRYSDEYGNNFGFVRPYDNKLWINFTQYKKEISGPEWIDLDSILD